MSKDESREAVYELALGIWQFRRTRRGHPEQLAAMKQAPSGH